MTTVEQIAQERIDALAQQIQQQEDVGDADDARAHAEARLHALEGRWIRKVPKRFLAARIDDLDDPVREAVEDWRRDPTRNLVLLGGVGTGKTHAAAAALRIALEADWSVAFWPVVELLDAMRPHGDEDTYDTCVNLDVLALDDLGTERPTDWTAERLYALVNRRWLEERPTIVTSNLSASNGRGPLVDAIGPRMYSRLVHGAVVAQLAGADRRRAP